MLTQSARIVALPSRVPTGPRCAIAARCGLRLGDVSMNDDTIDATDSIEEYAKGKTWECECGHGIGTHFEIRVVRCYSCGEYLVDEKAENREAPEVDSGQTTLGAWS